jgi:hypothetical protein
MRIYTDEVEKIAKKMVAGPCALCGEPNTYEHHKIHDLEAKIHQLAKALDEAADSLTEASDVNDWYGESEYKALAQDNMGGK